MNIPGTAPMGHLGIKNAGAGASAMDPEQAQAAAMMRTMQSAMESCPAKTAIAGTMGFGLGGMFGLFMSSMRYDTPMSSAYTAAGQAAPSIPMRQQLAAGLKDMGKASWSSAKNFGYIGAIYAGTECGIEGFRGKNELVNGVAAGCITGGILAKNAGPQAVAVGCAGFAAFSLAIDTYMRQPSEPAQGPRID